jgi:hypothetical protein
MECNSEYNSIIENLNLSGISANATAITDTMNKTNL